MPVLRYDKWGWEIIFPILNCRLSYSKYRGKVAAIKIEKLFNRQCSWQSCWHRRPPYIIYRRLKCRNPLEISDITIGLSEWGFPLSLELLFM